MAGYRITVDETGRRFRAVNALHAPGIERLLEVLESGGDLSTEDEFSPILIKENPARRVLRVAVDSRTYYVKEYRQPTLADKLRFRFAKSKAKREWEALLTLADKGVPVVEPAACIETRKSGFLSSATVVTTDAGPDTVPFIDFIMENYNSRKGRGNLTEKKTYIKYLARFLAAFIKAGAFNNDFHSGNILYRFNRGNIEFRLVDTANVTFIGEPTAKSVTEQLARFNMFYFQYASATDRTRFSQLLAEELPVLKENFRKIVRDAEDRTAEILNPFWVSRSRRCFGDNREFRRVSVAGSYRGFMVSGYAESGFDRLLGGRLSDILAGKCGEVKKDGRATKVVRVELDDAGGARVFYVKLFKLKKKFNVLKDLFRRTRAERCFAGSYAFSLRRIGTPKAVCALSRRVAGFPAESVVVTEDVGETKSVYEAYIEAAESPGGGKLRFIRAFAGELRKMHAKGVYHGDLKGDNILVRCDGPVLEFLFLDLDRFVQSVEPREILRIRDLAQLNREFVKWAPRRDRLRFLHSYLGEFAEDEQLRELALKVTEKTALLKDAGK